MAKGLSGIQVSFACELPVAFYKANIWPGSITESAIDTSLENPEIL